MTNIPIQEPAVYPCNGCQHQLFREVNAVVNAGPLALKASFQETNIVCAQCAPVCMHALHVLIGSIPDEEDFRQVYENMVVVLGQLAANTFTDTGPARFLLLCKTILD